MTLSFLLGCIWLITANVLAMLPSRDNLWRRAYFLIGVGVPLLGYITYENGPWWGLGFLVAGASMLRWTIVYFLRWMRQKTG